MVTTMDDFSNFFIPLFILGSWCLFEGEHIYRCSNVFQFIALKPCNHEINPDDDNANDTEIVHIFVLQRL